MRRKLIVGNWKMNGTRRSVPALLADLVAGVGRPACDVVVCPPFPLLRWCASVLDGSAIALAAQDVSEHDSGAYTGDVSAAMLKEAGCRHVLVGHSERRAFHRESDAAVARKAQRAILAGLTPIVCVGETFEERTAGATDSVLLRQVEAVLDALTQEQLPRIAIAYEPVWAIGTGAAATPRMAQDAHALIRRCFARYCAARPEAAQALRILYGGSVKPASAAGLLAMPDIDGALVGGASLDARDFIAIVQAAQDAALALPPSGRVRSPGGLLAARENTPPRRSPGLSERVNGA